jgi:hypothetical protein
MDKINIKLPDGRIIKRVLHTKYIANNSPVWVIVGGLKFSVDYYDLNNTNNNLYRLTYCYKDDFLKCWPRIFFTNRPKVDQKREHLIGVAGSTYDHEFNNIVVPMFFKCVKK